MKKIMENTKTKKRLKNVGIVKSRSVVGTNDNWHATLNATRDKIIMQHGKPTGLVFCPEVPEIC